MHVSYYELDIEEALTQRKCSSEASLRLHLEGDKVSPDSAFQPIREVEFRKFLSRNFLGGVCQT